MQELMERMKDSALMPPVAKLIEFRIEEVESGRCLVAMEAGEQHWNPMGIVHGGIFADLADAAMGIAFVSTLEPGEAFSTLELKMNYFRPVKTGRLIAKGVVVNAGKTVGYVEATVEDEQGRLIAKANSTCIILRGEKAAGRTPRAADGSA